MILLCQNKRGIYKNIDYINLFDILNSDKNNLTKSNQVYITNQGNLAIYNEIMRKINKLDLHKEY